MPRFIFKRRQRTESGVLAGGAHNHGVLNLIQIHARAVREAHANRIGTVIHNHRCCGRLTLQNGAGVEFDFLRREAGTGGQHGVHAHHYSGTADGVFNSVLNVFHNGDFFDPVPYFDGPLFQQSRVPGEELDFDGFGRAAQVADHVLQNLNELHIKLRIQRVDLLAEFRNNLINGALAIFLKMHQKVAGVGFGDGGEAQLKACAPRSAFHFRGLRENFFHGKKHSVGVFQGRTGGHEVIQHEAAFVHFRKQFAAQRTVAEE